MPDYLCLTVVSQPAESAGAFSGRLSTFWTSILRGRPDDFEKVYAETTAFENAGPELLSRMYLIESDIADLLENELHRAGFALHPIDREDTYTKYEAVSPEWMQIEH